MWRDLVKQQYRRAEAYTLWGESFKAFASGAMSPQEFESNVTLNVVPVLQEVGAAIRSLAALEPDASVQRWVEAVQVQEKVRYEATVLAMYTTIRHMGDVSMHSNECPFSERSFGCFTLGPADCTSRTRAVLRWAMHKRAPKKSHCIYRAIDKLPFVFSARQSCARSLERNAANQWPLLSTLP